MRADSLCFHHSHRPYLLACCAWWGTHTPTYACLRSLGFHIWCAILLLLLQRPNLCHKLPVFLIQAVQTTNWGKGSFLSFFLKQKSTLYNCVNVELGVNLITACGSRVFWHSPKETKALCSGVQSGRSLGARFTCEGLLECVYRYLLYACLFY